MRPSIRAGLWRRALAAIALPAQDCRLCGRRTGREPLCPDCRASLPFAWAESCPRCALPSVAGNECGQCRRDPPPLDGVVAALEYRWPVDRLVQALKYRGEIAVAALLGELLACRAAAAPRPDALVPVPLSRRRLGARGYNQTVEIGRRVSRTLQVPLAWSCVWRLQEGPAQASLPWDRRAANVAGAFACRLPRGVAHVAIVDDVMTTGATLHALARTIRAAGATRVDAWVVARTPLPVS
jgi:ComF family protein